MRKNKNVYDDLPDYEEENEYYEDEYETYGDEHDWEEEVKPRRASKGRHVKPKAQPSRGKRIGRGVLIGLLALVLVIVIAGVLIFNHFYGMMNVEDKDDKAPVVTPAPVVTEVTPEPTEAASAAEPTVEPTATPAPLSEEELKILELQEVASDLTYDKNVYNILLVGTDDRIGATEGRTDAMFILSINKETKKIWISSMQRDMWVDLPGGGTGKINSTNIRGGIDMLKETVENVFAVNIDNYVVVNFADFIELADMAGGITVTMTGDEVYEMNLAIVEVNCHFFDPNNSNDGIIWDLVDGTYQLNGKQTLGYCRMRALDGTMARSARQRDAMVQMWNNVKQMPVMDIYKMVETGMGIITTDMTRGQCASLMLMLPSMISYDIHTIQLPVENSYFRSSVDGQGCYFLDYYVNRAYLRGTVYGQEIEEKELKSVLTKMTAELPDWIE